MLRGNTDLTCTDLLDCFDWSGAEFAAIESDVPQFLREMILDDSSNTRLSSEQRLHLLEWCTGLTALPCSGLAERIVLRLYVEADANDLPIVHTCTHELHMPAYNSREQLHAKLLKAVEHRHDGFQIE